jgi:hypothetical protein
MNTQSDIAVENHVESRWMPEIREINLMAARRYRENNREKVREASKRYYRANREKCLEGSRRYWKFGTTKTSEHVGMQTPEDMARILGEMGCGDV